MTTQLTYKVTNPKAENRRDKFDSEASNSVWTTDSEKGKWYSESTFLRVMGIGAFVQQLASEGKKIVWMTFEGNLLGFILDEDE